MGTDDSHAVSRRWTQWRDETDLQEYFTRWERLEAAGQSSHGEADFIQSFQPRSVLDAGCGMGRVAIELHRRGIEVVGVDLDDDLLDFARRTQPEIRWVHADLATMSLGRTFDVVAMPGNVMIFCRPTDRAAVVRNAATHVVRGGHLVTGFELQTGPDALTLGEYDELCSNAGLELLRHCSTWQGAEYCGENYAVTVHRTAHVMNPEDGRR